MNPLLAPLTPPDCDLRDFRFMPLDVVRFAQSDLVSFEDPAAVVAAILLWGAAWHGTPAGSLTDDDRSLCRLAGYGRGGAEWERVREGAMRGWVKCSDSRLYHPVVAEKVVEAWAGRLKLRHRTYCAAIRKHNERHPDDHRSAPNLEQWEALGRPELVTRDMAAVSRVTASALSRPSHTKKRSKGEGQGTGDSGQGIYPSGGAAASRGSRLASDWSLPREWRDWTVAELSWDQSAIDREAAKFADWWHAKAGKDAAKVDWLATWRGWCRRADEPRAGGRRDPGSFIPGSSMISPC